MSSAGTHGHHILRAYSKNSFVKQYEKDHTFLRIETCSNNLKDVGQKKALKYLPEVAAKRQAVNDRFADAQAENITVERDYLRPIAGSLFNRPPESTLKPRSKLQAQYRQNDQVFP